MERIVYATPEEFRGLVSVMRKYYVFHNGAYIDNHRAIYLKIQEMAVYPHRGIKRYPWYTIKVKE